MTPFNNANQGLQSPLSSRDRFNQELHLRVMAACKTKLSFLADMTCDYLHLLGVPHSRKTSSSGSIYIRMPHIPGADDAFARNTIRLSDHDLPSYHWGHHLGHAADVRPEVTLPQLLDIIDRVI